MTTEGIPYTLDEAEKILQSPAHRAMMDVYHAEMMRWLVDEVKRLASPPVAPAQRAVFGVDGADVGHIPLGTCGKRLHDQLVTPIKAGMPHFCQVGRVVGVTDALATPCRHFAGATENDLCTHVTLGSTLTVRWYNNAITSGFAFRDVLVVRT